MPEEILKGRDFSPEFTFSASRSSGPGGQNVNKLNTRVELRFNIISSALLTNEEKEILQNKLASKITAEGEIILVSQSERSQLKNKEKVTTKFYNLLIRTLRPAKKRIPIKPPQALVEKRLEEKRLQAEKKERRKKL